MSEGTFHSEHDFPTTQIHGLKIPGPFAEHVVTPDPEHPSSTVITLPDDFWGERAGDIYQDPRYFSGEHGAYSEGYDLETRVDKYRDAIGNTVDYWAEQPGSYIDFGGGPGYFAWGVAQEAIDRELITPDQVQDNVVVADVSTITDPEVEKLGIRRVQTTISELPDELRQGQFSTASCLHTMEHIPHDRIEPSIKAMHEALKNDGLLYLIIPTLDGRVQDNPEIFNQILYDRTHVTLGTRDWWREQFKKIGFSEDQEAVDTYDTKGYGWVFCFRK